MTMPASVVMATRSSIVRPVLSTRPAARASVGRVSFWSAPTAKVTPTASMPAWPASQSDIISV